MRVLLDILYCWYNEAELHFPNQCNWPVLWEYIDRHGLSGLAGSLAIDGLAAFPGEIHQAATHRYLSNQLRYEQALRCCTIIQQTAQRLDIPITILKGPAIVFQGYEDEGARSFCDIDLFTENRETVIQLRDELQGPLIKDSANQSRWKRLTDAEGISFRLENWELEFRYLIDPPREPMFEILEAHRLNLFKIPEKPEEIINPDPAVHLIYLLHHMAAHHLFSRFFWFLDLAVLVREQKQHIDFDFVERELDRVGQRNCMAVASTFCRDYIDPDFPVISPRLPAWNYPILNRFIDPANIANGRFGIYHESLWQTILSYMYALVGFYLIEDPRKPFLRLGFGTTWTLDRIKNSLGLRYSSRLLDFLFGSTIRSGLVPFARLLVWLTCLAETRKKIEITDRSEKR